MGTVYRAVHVEMEREVALKVLPPEMSKNETMVARFKREAKAAAQLQHENIVQVFDVKEDKGRYFIAMEFIRGKDLSDLIAEKKMLPVKQAIDILRQATRALEHAFQKGIVHRDIKPSNFIVTKDGKVKLCDMGLALRTDAGEEAKVTRDGTTVGTVDYMSPEQARDSRLADTRSDMYSLGCTLYQMLTGRVPFEEGSIPEKLYKHATETPLDPLQFNPDIPPAVIYILNKMLEKKPDDRYQTPKSLLEDLDTLSFDADAKPDVQTRKTLAIGVEEDETATEQVLLQRPSVKKKEEEARRRAQQGKQMLMYGGAAVAAVVVFAVVGWLMFGRGGESTEPPVDPAKGVAKVEPASKPNLPVVPNKPSTDTNASSGGSTTKPDPTKTGGSTESAAGAGSSSSTEPGKTAEPGKTPEATPPTEPTDTAPKPIDTRPRLTPEQRKELKDRLFPDWPTARIEGDPARVARGAKQEAGGVFAKLEFACTDAKSGNKRIQLEDNGPFFERGFLLQRATLEIRPRLNVQGQYQFRPVVALDMRAEQAPKASLVEAKNSSLVVEGIDFVVNADDFRETIGNAKPFAFFDVHGSDLVLKNCTFTIIGRHSESVSIVRFGGVRDADPGRTPPKLARLTIENCFARGEPLTAVTVTSPLADVKIQDSLFVAGQSAALLDLKPPVDKDAQPTRTVRIVRSTCVTRGDFLTLDGGAGSASAVPTELKLIDTIVACATTSGSHKLVRLKNWPEEGGSLKAAKIEERSALYLGWQNLAFVVGVGRVLAATPEEWKKLWRLDTADMIARRENWPTEELGEVHKAVPESFAPNEVAAEIPSRLGEDYIGCATRRLPAMTPLLVERTYARLEPPRLLPLEKLLPSFMYNPQKNPQLGAWQGEQNRRRTQPGAPVKGDEPDPVREITFNVNQSGDLGLHLQTLAQQNELPDTTIVVVTGTGVVPLSPVKLTGNKSLVIWVNQTQGQSPVFSPKPGTEPAEAVFDVRDGDLIIDGATIMWPQGAPAGMPKKFVRVDRGNLTLNGCKLYGPLAGESGFEAIQFTGGPQAVRPKPAPATGAAAGLRLDFHPPPHAAVNACQLIDCYVGAEAACVRALGAQCVVRMTNCLAVSAGSIALLEDLEHGGAESFENSVIVEQCTLAASKSFFDVGEWLAKTLPKRPLVIDTRGNLFCDPFDVAIGVAARNRNSVLLRYGAGTLHQGLLHWESSNDAVTHELHTFVLGRDKDISSTPRKKSDAEWLALWGRVHVQDFLVDGGSSYDKIRLKGSNLKLRDFERDKRFADLELDSRSDAAKKGIGVDLKRLFGQTTN
jgi:serine/threonine-protein kinase